MSSCELWSWSSLHFSEMLAMPVSLERERLLGALGSFKAKLLIFSDHIEHWLFLGVLWTLAGMSRVPFCYPMLLMASNNCKSVVSQHRLTVLWNGA